ncbi:type II toxin-antitoxin system ParD family antitoxin [Azospirillum sp. ST 5-10]|uniref:type II toxin-antitoxin system ParD family antitoxin n=1 Tax=unclassified Azospirillum TaxID=2630922 RepID=UPI003F49DCF9
MPTRNINLTDTLDRLIDEEVSSGRHQNASEVVRAGLRLFEQRRREETLRLQALHAALDVAIAEADRGDVAEIDGIDRFVDDVVASMEAGEAHDQTGPGA